MTAMPKSWIVQTAITLAFAAGAAFAQVGHTETSLDWMGGDADLVLRGKVSGVAKHRVKEPIVWLDVTLKAVEILKGPVVDTVTIAVITVGEDKRWAQFIASEPREHLKGYSFPIPRSLAQRTGRSGDANSVIVSGDRRLEKLAHLLIDSAEEIVPRGAVDPRVSGGLDDEVASVLRPPPTACGRRAQECCGNSRPMRT